MDRLKALEIFSSVAIHGSFVRGGEALNLSKPATTKAIQDLEELLGVRLLQRTTRSLSLTAVGKDVLERASGLLASFEELAAISSLSAREVSGTVRLAAPTAYGARRMTGPLASFAAKYPKVRIELHTTEDEVDLVEDRVDLGVWVGGELPLGSIPRCIGLEAVGLFAAPAYLERCGRPLDPLGLAGHDELHYVGSTPLGPWRFTRDDVVVDAPPPRPWLSSNNEETLVAAAVHGAGLLRLPECLVAPELSSGRLVKILADWQLEPLSVQLAYSSRRGQPLAVRKLIEHLATSLQ